MTSTENKDPNRKDFVLMLIIFSLFVIICHFILTSCQVKKQYSEKSVSEAFIKEEIQKSINFISNKEENKDLTENVNILEKEIIYSLPDSVGKQYVRIVRTKEKKQNRKDKSVHKEQSYIRDTIYIDRLVQKQENKEIKGRKIVEESFSSKFYFFLFITLIVGVVYGLIKKKILSKFL